MVAGLPDLVIGIARARLFMAIDEEAQTYTLLPRSRTCRRKQIEYVEEDNPTLFPDTSKFVTLVSMHHSTLLEDAKLLRQCVGQACGTTRRTKSLVRYQDVGLQGSLHKYERRPQGMESKG